MQTPREYGNKQITLFLHRQNFRGLVLLVITELDVLNFL